jgi:uncharacterized membrane protein
MVGESRQGMALRLNEFTYWFSRHWLLVFTLFLGVFIGLPWLAPLFMALGWTPAGQVIYLLYTALCHQLPQRSFFLFGDTLMLPLDKIQSIWTNSDNPLVLRQFVGNAEVGWKVAWSDRMVYMYSSLLLFGLLFWPLRKRLKPLPLWGLLLFLLPMAVDGSSHAISDLVGGIDGGFRFTNSWLAALAGNIFSATFYSGDTLGSFNSWMRLISGLLFGLGVIWFAFPRLHTSFNHSAGQIAAKLERARVKQAD